jgi:hypothetical protein
MTVTATSLRAWKLSLLAYLSSIIFAALQTLAAPPYCITNVLLSTLEPFNIQSIYSRWYD